MSSSLNQLLHARRGAGPLAEEALVGPQGPRLDEDRVEVVIETTPAAIGQVRRAVVALGGTYETHYAGLLQALVPVEAVETLAERDEVRLVREPMRPIPASPLSATAAKSEGVEASNAAGWHAAGYTGAGVRLAVIGGAFGGYAALLGSELPASVSTYDWTGEGMGVDNHGTACAEIVHDMAPDATIDLHRVSSDVELGNAVDQAIADGADVISFSEGFPLGGPGDGTGPVAEIVERARDHGILFAVAAGNEARLTWSGTYQDAPSEPTIHQWPGGNLYNCFGPGSGGAPCAPIEAGTPILVALRWDDWNIVDQDYNLGLFADRGAGWELVAFSANQQGTGCDCTTPTELINVAAPFDAVYSVVVSKADARGDACLYLTVPRFDGQVEHLEDAVAARSLSSPADSPDAVAVGAVDVEAPYALEPYSSRGPTFGSGGACSGGFIKPDIAAYANVSTASYGPDVFPGTSAATPHVAGAAALVKQAYPAYSVSQLQVYLEDSAVDVGTTGKDTLYGAGRLYLGDPNRKPYAPSAPSPEDGATEVSVEPTLSWTGGDPDTGDTVTYTVYLEAGDSTPDVPVCEGLEMAACDPGTLLEGGHYYWAVEATDNHGASSRGEAWAFTTEGTNQLPHEPADPTPPDGAVNQAVDVDLSWTGGDPDPEDTVTYDVYLEAGDTTPDELVCVRVMDPLCDPGALLEEATYYWAVEAIDNRGISTTGDTWHFTTAGPNTAPVIGGLPDQEVAKNSSLDDAIDLWAYAGDQEDDVAALTFSISNSPVPSANVTIDANQTIDIEPLDGWSGTTEVEIQVEDTGGLTDRDTFEVRVRSASFIKHVVSNSCDGAHDVYATDLDSDGDVDILAAASDDDTLVWWENDSEESFTEHVIGGDFSQASAAYATDVDGDGDIDLLGAADWGGDIAWWENDGEQGFTKHLIDGSFRGAYDVYAVDLDGDGDVDVLGAASSDDAIAWWENDGDQGFIKHIIDGAFDSAQSVYAADVDGDGDLDVLGAAYWDDEIAWWENNGDQGFTKHGIDDAFLGAVSVYATDVDGDGDVDVLGAAERAYAIAWWENDGAAAFTKHPISEVFEVTTSVFATDVDGDGAVDVLGASWYDGVAWWENDGQQAFTQYAVDGDFYPAQSVYATDVDGDGDMDVLAVAEFDDEVAWWEQIGEPDNRPPAAPGDPAPADGAEGVSIETDLRWTGGDPDAGDSVTYEVYLGTSSPPPLVATVGPYSATQTALSYDPGALEPGSEYVWYIAASDEEGASVTGELWSFTTEEANQLPHQPSDPTPPDGAVHQPLDVTLGWTGGDPDVGDSLTYDVYLGTSSPPPLVASVGPYSATQTALTYDPGALEPGSEYVWYVVAHDDRGGSATGVTWSFTTGEFNRSPYEPSDPAPPDGATDQPLDVMLSWTGGDPDAGDSVTYDVYLGTSSPPPLWASVGPYSATQTLVTYDPDGLRFGADYVWYIVVNDDRGGSTTGATWSFTTEEPAASSYLPLVLRGSMQASEVQEDQGSRTSSPYLGRGGRR